MRGQKELYLLFEKLNIQFEYHEHPPLATIEDTKIHWKNYNSGRCKNIFFRNHMFLFCPKATFHSYCSLFS
jgi:hypothetical protein